MQMINFVQLWLLIMRLMKLILIYPCLCPPIQIFLCPFIVIVLQGSSLSTTHSYIITILLGSKLFFKFCNFWYLSALLLKVVLRNEINKVSPSYTTTRNYTHDIVNIVCLASFPKEVSRTVPSFVDIVLNSGVMYLIDKFPKEVPKKFITCYN